ncbi:MAG: flavodoxin family protein [Clostridia bacterium]|nr:flavodoxin family protein [Clostridia bacterium]
MKILVLNGSPRKNMNTAFMCQAFKEGAMEAGHDVEVIQVGTMDIKGCTACEYCHTTGEGICTLIDDMVEILPKLKDCDMLVFASPIYYMGMTAQMHAAINRMYAVGKPGAKKFALLLSSGSPGFYDAAITQYKQIVGFMGAQDMGIITAYGDQNKSEEKKDEIFAFAKAL